MNICIYYTYITIYYTYAFCWYGLSGTVVWWRLQSCNIYNLDQASVKPTLHSIVVRKSPNENVSHPGDGLVPSIRWIDSHLKDFLQLTVTVHSVQCSNLTSQGDQGLSDLSFHYHKHCKHYITPVSSCQRLNSIWFSPRRSNFKLKKTFEMGANISLPNLDSSSRIIHEELAAFRCRLDWRSPWVLMLSDWQKDLAIKYRIVSIDWDL